MKCTGCFKEFTEEEKAYATVVGSIEKDSLSNQDDYGFYMSDIESWLSVLCEDCGMATHKFIAEQMNEMKYNPEKPQSYGIVSVQKELDTSKPASYGTLKKEAETIIIKKP